ncbi:hypothetical protein [Brachybacterium sp. AOP3-A1-3]|uniref:hypothetical protein n=1 Tax=Brachybacterium sp. AOP3-A1-3 TaxID=3457699 RepID=UPI004033F787
MIDHELTDPAGGALTITHDHQGVWITATEGRDEVTVGPFPARTLRASFDMGDDLMDGGVTAAAIEAEVDGKAMWEKTRTDHLSPERARSLVQERDEAKAEAAMCQTSLRGQIRRAEQAEDTLLMVQQQRDHLRATLATTARQRDEADKRAATASPRPLTADDITDEMVERGARQYIEEDYTSWERSPALAKNNARESVRGILEAALTPPPSRPEGAEGLADDLSGWDEMDDYGNRRFTHEELDDLADHLAALGYRKTP